MVWSDKEQLGLLGRDRDVPMDGQCRSVLMLSCYFGSRIRTISAQAISLKHLRAVSVLLRFVIRRWQQSGARRGWKVYEELQQQACLARPPSTVCSVASSLCPAARKPSPAPSTRVNRTQAASEASSKVVERCMAVLDPEDTTVEKARAQTVLPHPAKRILHTGSPTIGEGSRRSGLMCHQICWTSWNAI